MCITELKTYSAIQTLNALLLFQSLQDSDHSKLIEEPVSPGWRVETSIILIWAGVKPTQDICTE